MNPKPPGSAVVTYNYYVSIQVGSVQTGAKGPPIWKFRDDPDITNSPPPPDGVASKRG
ncbi:MAG TPA: hypothetical protein VJZ00_11840 [Thermoanaerobaculia bacterium]|nr:hypothetical protein [Thermoanaerobaculia bacterium]